MSRSARIIFVISAAVLVAGVILDSVLLMGLAWLLLWVAAAGQDRHNRRPA